jgi:hypothetical protein
VNYDAADATTDAIALAGSSMQVEMAVRVGESLELTDAWWDLVPIVVAAGDQHDRMSPADVADATAAGRRLTEEARSRIREAARQWEEKAYAAFDRHALDESAVASLSLAEVMADPYAVLTKLVDIQSVATEVMPALMDAAPVTSIDEAFYYFSYLRAVRRSRRTPLLLRALFVAAVGTIEPLVTRMVQRLLHHAQPQVYPSLADPALAEKARKLCFGSPQDWRTALVDDLGISKLADAIDWHRLDQLWQDRNAIVHRGGVVDARHSAKSGVEIGTILDLRPDDVRAAIDEIGAARYGIVTAVWDHLAPGVGARLAEETWPTLWDSLRAGRWRQAEGLGRVQEAFANDPEGVATAKVHRWLAREQGMGAQAIRDEVQAWDVSGLPARFEMARLILLSQDEQALRLLAGFVADGSVTPADLAAWPLIDRLREDGRLAHLVPDSIEGCE